MKKKIELILGDITTIPVDAMVNAANSLLLAGAGVSGAIHAKAGQSVIQECQNIREKQGGCQTGEAVVTSAGNLPAKYIIHSVGPIWEQNSPQQEKQLQQAYLSALNLASQLNLQSISLPNISTGIYNFPKKQAALVAIETVRNFLREQTSLQRVLFICYDQTNFDLYQQFLANQYAKDFSLRIDL